MKEFEIMINKNLELIRDEIRDEIRDYINTFMLLFMGCLNIILLGCLIISKK